jgi:hypothetical protein
MVTRKPAFEKREDRLSLHIQVNQSALISTKASASLAAPMILDADVVADFAAVIAK